MLKHGTTTGATRAEALAQAEIRSRVASPKPHSTWIGAVCARCHLPISATPHLAGSQVTGHETWAHVATGNEECGAP